MQRIKLKRFTFLSISTYAIKLLVFAILEELDDKPRVPDDSKGSWVQ